MKKTYLQPDTEIQKVNVVQMLSASITGVGGGSGLGQADPSDPILEEGDVKEFIFEENPWEY